MNTEKAREIFLNLESSKAVKNYFARANARYTLFDVGESRERFPETLEANLDHGANGFAFAYLSTGCHLAESRVDLEASKIALEKGAEFIHFTHIPVQNRNEISPYFLLIGGLAYYASGQYSKAFIVMKKADQYNTDVSNLISNFLKKQFNEVYKGLDKILLDDNYVAKNSDITNEQERIHVVIFAKAMASLVEYLFSGNQNSLDKSLETLSDLLELLKIDSEPSLWWVTRLFRIIATEFKLSSLWATIPPRINDNETNLRTRYIKSLIYGKKSLTELFISQRKAMPKVLSPGGAVVSLPTSSGKTLIAEIAILQCLCDTDGAKVLYLAPFRSLAFEVESRLKETFGKLGFEVSQLYGSSHLGSLEKHVIQESDVLIATPEKAKLILRTNKEITDQIKLVIIDEGHLLNTQNRQVRNEIFIEELRKYIQDNDGKILLLSAVLPNVGEISNWISQDEKKFIRDDWRPSSQLFGLLEFTGRSVTLRWQNEEKSFNANFVKPFTRKIRLKTKVKTERFPKNKREAVAYSAAKLSNSGTVLIFVGSSRNVASTVLKYAEDVMTGLGKDSKQVEYNSDDWKLFKLSCRENGDEYSRILELASCGIICHHGSMSHDFRLCLENLMRSGKTKVIVSTSTLAQGVNLNISSVIIANHWINQREMPATEFWNIAGRAGRAYMDIEGKVLFAIDETKEPWKIKRDKNKALNDYFQLGKLENVTSGILQCLTKIKSVAIKTDTSFDLLLQMISENDYFQLTSIYGSRNSNTINEFFELLDDALLAIQIQFVENPEQVDDYFRQTLACLQAKNFQGIEETDVIAFLKARSKAIKGTIIPDKSKWKSAVSSGLPLLSSIKLDRTFSDIVDLANDYQNSLCHLEDKISLLKAVESIMHQMPSADFSKKFKNANLDKVRDVWLSGESLSLIQTVSDRQKISTHYFGYTVSWFLGAIGQRFKESEFELLAEVFEEMTICCELGVPNLVAAKIYLSGIRSRLASTELSKTIQLRRIAPNANQKAVKYLIGEHILEIRKQVIEPITLEWLDFFEKTSMDEDFGNSNSAATNLTIPAKKEFKATRLLLRRFRAKYFLCSPDYTERVLVEPDTSLELNAISNKLDIYFEQNEAGWDLCYQNQPAIKTIADDLPF